MASRPIAPSRRRASVSNPAPPDRAAGAAKPDQKPSMDPHDVLGLPPEAPDYEIRRRYLDLAAELRPRENPDDRDRLQELNQAYQALQTGDGAPAVGDTPSAAPALPPEPQPQPEPPSRSRPQPESPQGQSQPPPPSWERWPGPASGNQPINAPGPTPSSRPPNPGAGIDLGALGGPVLKVAAVVGAFMLLRYMGIGIGGFFIMFALWRWIMPMARGRRH